MSLKEGKFPPRRPVWDVVINNGSIGVTMGASMGMPADAAAPGHPSWPLHVNIQLHVQMNARGKQEVRNKLVDVLTDGKMNCLPEIPPSVEKIH